MSKAARLIRPVLMGAVLLVVLNALYLGFMTLSFSIPVGTRAREHMEASMEIFASEKHEPPVFYDGSILATAFGSDILWVDTALMRADDPLYNAVALPHKEAVTTDAGTLEGGFYGMLVPLMYYYDSPETVEYTYARFWMLFTGLIRILFQWMKWNEIRYFFWTLTAGLILYDAWMLAKKCGWRGLLPFGLAVMMRNLLFLVASFTTCTDSILSFASMAVVLACHEKQWFQKYRGLYYLGLGSMSFAIGTMESPMLAFGMTLLTDLLLMREAAGEKVLTKEEEKSSWIATIVMSALWAAGYVVTVLAKALLAQMILGDNGGGDGMMGHYISSHGGGIAARWARIGYCMNKLFTPAVVKVPMMAAVVIVLLILMRKSGVVRRAYLWQILFVALYPCFWAFVVVEHSMHDYASNVFAAFVYGVLIVLAGLVKERTESGARKT